MNAIATNFKFKDAFCAKYGCRLEDYAREMVLRSFSPHARLIARILLHLETPSIRQALDAVDMLAFAEDLHDVNTVLKDYRYRLRQPCISSWVHTFKIRLSGSRVMAIFMTIKEEAESNLLEAPAQPEPIDLEEQAVLPR